MTSLKSFKEVEKGDRVVCDVCSEEFVGLVTDKGTFDELVGKGFFTDTDRETLIEFDDFTEEDLQKCIAVNDSNSTRKSVIMVYGFSASCFE